MHRRILRVVGTFMLAAGLLLAGVPSGDSGAYDTARASTKRASSKKTPKKSGKTADKKSAKRSNDRASARAGNRGKNADSKQISRRAGGRVERRPARKTEPRKTEKERVEPKLAKAPSRDAEEVDDVDEPATPRPANRYVGEIGAGRVMEIQNALAKAGVFAGPATGVYDQSTFQAMSTFQARRGFGVTGMPTAEALKALGVRKNSGVGITTPAGVLRSTSPSAAAPQPAVPSGTPNR
jgi:hypothetical protein